MTLLCVICGKKWERDDELPGRKPLTCSEECRRIRIYGRRPVARRWPRCVCKACGHEHKDTVRYA